MYQRSSVITAMPSYMGIFATAAARKKKLYQQGWGKTLLKFWLTSSVYYVLFMSAVMGLIILSILWS